MASKIDKARAIIKKGGPAALAEKGVNYTLRTLRIHSFVYMPYCMLRINSIKRSRDLDKQIDFVLTKCDKFIRPLQIRSEISSLLKILKEKKPRYILEIGTAKGGTLFLLSRAASDDALLVSLDLPQGRFGGGYPKWKIPLYESFGSPRQKIHLIRADSHDPSSVEKVKDSLKGNKLDFLFIDGDHTYDGVKKDFEMYSPLVKEDGLVGFHDIAPHTRQTGCEVERFWNEVKKGYEHTEFIEDMNQNMGGIGLIKFKKSI